MRREKNLQIDAEFLFYNFTSLYNYLYQLISSMPKVHYDMHVDWWHCNGMAMGLKGEGLGALGGKKKTTSPEFYYFYFWDLPFFYPAHPNPVPRSKNFLYRSAPDNLITLVIFRVNGSVAMIIDFFFSLSRTLILNHLIVGPLSLKVLDSVNYDCD